VSPIAIAVIRLMFMGKSRSAVSGPRMAM